MFIYKKKNFIKRLMKNGAGFTLIETLLYMGIFSILIIVLFTLLTSIFDVQLESQSTAAVASDGRFILNRFAYDIRKAESFTSPASIGGQGPILEFQTGGMTYSYTISNGNLILTNSTLGTADQLNSYNTTLSDVNFLRLSDTNSEHDTISFSFTLESKTQKRGGAAEQNFKTTVGKR